MKLSLNRLSAFLRFREQLSRTAYWLIIGGVAATDAFAVLLSGADGFSGMIVLVSLWVCLAAWIGRLKDAGRRTSLVLIPLTAVAAVWAAALTLFPIVLFGSALLMVPHFLSASLGSVFVFVSVLSALPIVVFSLWFGFAPTRPETSSEL